ncbi:MAG: putative DNA binding domain-containing protein [Firmicutes bacterium]|nr:putative DNA binding domain-containing protein [Bacillota bacterium]
MTTSLSQLQALMNGKEDEHLEFKEAKNQFDFDDLLKYCAALANERGGKFILGISDKKPRKVVGSNAFSSLERTKASLYERLHLRIEAEDVRHPDGRVVIFHIPSRPLGMPIQYKGTYWMRAGDTLAPMSPDQLKKIFDETVIDFSAEICHGASIDELDPSGIKLFRDMWVRKSGNNALLTLSDEQLLSDAELIVDGSLTYAALILFGTHQALGKYMAQAEVIFEYRSGEASIPAQQRKEYRQGFFLFEKSLLETINLRNEVQQFQDGLFIWDIPTFGEAVVREAILNAVSHRDYRLPGSIFVYQFPRVMKIVSPGGLPLGITEENIFFRQIPRNRRIAEAFSKCGLVERSGQGINRMFEESIKDGKPKPDFSGTDDYQVSVTLRGEIQDLKFLRFLEQIGKERLSTFTTQHYLVLDLIHREKSIPDELRFCLPSLLDNGVIERVGKGRGVRYLLSRRFYGFLGKKGDYTRTRGLDRETNKELILKHIRDNQKDGSQLKELFHVLPSLSHNQIQTLLRELKAEEKIYNLGRTKAAKWYPDPGHRKD